MSIPSEEVTNLKYRSRKFKAYQEVNMKILILGGKRFLGIALIEAALQGRTRTHTL